jgi:hypothetical protein
VVAKKEKEKRKRKKWDAALNPTHFTLPKHSLNYEALALIHKRSATYLRL